MPDVFGWKAINSTSGQATFRVRRAQFGDGYSQEAANGINNKVQSWPLQFAGSEDEMQAIIDFFDACAGYRSFLWTPPLGKQGLYKVALYTPSPLGGPVYTISATFEEKFAP